MSQNNLKTLAKHFTRIIIIISILLVLIDFTFHRHAYFALEEIYGFQPYLVSLALFSLFLLENG